MGRMRNMARAGLKRPMYGERVHDIPSFELPATPVKVPKFEKGETMGVDGKTYGWFFGFDENDKPLLMMAGRIGEGVVPIEATRLSYRPSAKQVPPPEQFWAIKA